MEDFNETSGQGGGCCDWRKTVDDLSAQADKFVRDDPNKAMGFALLGGILLTILPVGRLLSALVRLVFALGRPLLFILGAVKLYEECQKCSKTRNTHTP